MCLGAGFTTIIFRLVCCVVRSVQCKLDCSSKIYIFFFYFKPKSLPPCRTLTLNQDSTLVTPADSWNKWQKRAKTSWTISKFSVFKQQNEKGKVYKFVSDCLTWKNMSCCHTITLLLTSVPPSDRTQPTLAWPDLVLWAGRRLWTAEPAPLLSEESHLCDTPTGIRPTAPLCRVNRAGKTRSPTAPWAWMPNLIWWNRYIHIHLH